MGWLFGQLWFLLIIAFAVGALVAWALVKMMTPHVDELEAETGQSAKGALS
ncbi:MAG: hypothetical protein V9E81_10095 [Marmoricola sp.]|jgi:hypothetical protein